MLRNSNSTPPKSSVKLFPRLANPKRRFATADRPLAPDREKSPTAASQREADIKRVRARLLKMILENERQRGNDWRPTAG